jgi:hypothetical protein
VLDGLPVITNALADASSMCSGVADCGPTTTLAPARLHEPVPVGVDHCLNPVTRP